jgi:hypothetical protein
MVKNVSNGYLAQCDISERPAAGRFGRWLLGGGVVCAAVLAIAAAEAAREAPKPPNDLVVHEWGTFLAMHGSDGTTLDGMYHEEHALPPFVHSRRRDQLFLPTAQLKGETPVIYFYTQYRQAVNVGVEFPSGIWTQWYPQAAIVAPGLSTAVAPASQGSPRNGYIEWAAELIPPSTSQPAPTLPNAAKGALWHFARAVDAAHVRTIDHTRSAKLQEWERFLFYRGLGRGKLSLETSTENGGTLTWHGHPSAPARHLFVLRVENGTGSFRYLPALAPGETIANVLETLSQPVPLESFTETVADQLARRLTEVGLYPKEARAMVNTWRTSYLQSDGVRVLFILPQQWTDAFIPLRITPVPKELVRVMVGRVELLTVERERRAAQAVHELVAADDNVRHAAFRYLRDQGRYVEPVIRRVWQTTSDTRLAQLCQRLLRTDEVTELRSAVNAPTDGARLIEDPLDVRAQLACLLREIGCDDEARAEGQTVLSQLRRRSAPSLDNHEARHYLRSQARALEAIGDDAAAAAAYARFIRFASQVITNRACVGCHQAPHSPRDRAWFDDWWAGRRYAGVTRRAGQLSQATTDCQAALAKNPDDVAAQMMLGYLSKTWDAQFARRSSDRSHRSTGAPPQ